MREPEVETLNTLAARIERVRNTLALLMTFVGFLGFLLGVFASMISYDLSTRLYDLEDRTKATHAIIVREAME